MSHPYHDYIWIILRNLKRPYSAGKLHQCYYSILFSDITYEVILTTVIIKNFPGSEQTALLRG